MADEIRINREFSIAGDELDLTAIRSQGAGGQNVNKVATAIQLQFDIARCPSLPARVRSRLLARGDQRISSDGILTIKAQEHRSQARNRQAAIDRLVELLQEAAVDEKPRRPTRPSRSAMRKRIDEKKKRGEKKRYRGKPPLD